MRTDVLLSASAMALACSGCPAGADIPLQPAPTAPAAPTRPARTMAPVAPPPPPEIASSVEPERGTGPGGETAAKIEHRCGWVDNPTPANWWITDRDGEWIIGVQGGYQARGDLPDFGARWVETNGHYGYGCACMDVRIDRAAKRVIEVRAVTVLPIARCQKDKSLPAR